MRRILALLCLAATARGIAPPFRAPAPRIIDGADARFGEFPWYALFLGNLAGGNGILYCGAFLAGENVAITAAHCLGHDDTLIDTARLYFQSGSAPDGDQRFTSVFANVLYAAKHPSYTGSQDWSRLYWYDIAVLFLDARIVGVPLPQININSATPKPNDFAVIGFGRTSTDGAPSRVLRQTDVVRYDSTLCEAVWGRSNVGFDICAVSNDAGCRCLPSNPFCASNCDDICSGDSGGPLFHVDASGKPVVFGIVSRGWHECGSGMPSIYSDISVYGDFVRSALKSGSDASAPSGPPATASPPPAKGLPVSTVPSPPPEIPPVWSPFGVNYPKTRSCGRGIGMSALFIIVFVWI